MTNVTPFRQKPANDPGNPPAFNIPPCTLALVASMVGVYAILAFAPSNITTLLSGWLVFMPIRVMQPDLQLVTSLIGYGFVHGGFLHLASNMVMLLALGTVVERSLGKARLLALFCLGSVAGACCQSLIDWAGTTPMVGASAGIAALFGAYVMMLPTAEARRKMAAVLGLLFIVTAVLFLPLSGDKLAWAAHLGGLAAGLLQTGLWLRRRL